MSWVVGVRPSIQGYDEIMAGKEFEEILTWTILLAEGFIGPLLVDEHMMTMMIDTRIEI